MLFAVFKPRKSAKQEVEKPCYNFSSFVTLLVDELKANGQERTARAYQSVCNGVLSFSQKELSWEEIDSRFIKRYEAHLRKNGKLPNTISFYMRNFRAILNKARKAKLVPRNGEYSFEEVYTGIDKTEKRAVKKGVINKLEGLDLSLRKKLQLSQHLFMFSFYTRGMSFIDIAYLRKTNLKDGIIRYRRHKTGQWLEIKVTPEISRIINYYKDETAGSQYLLPILKGASCERMEYENALKTHNNRLQRISKILGLNAPLTSYVARHSWATIAKELHIPLSVISEGLGHNSEKTTQIYLASFDSSVLHRANAKVIA